MSPDWNGIQSGNSKYKAEIIKVGLEHSLATQYTSFVAVEERTVVSDGKPVKIEVPVELPQGVSPLAVPGGQFDRLETFAKLSSNGAVGGGLGGGIGAGTYNVRSAQIAPPPPSPGSSNEMVEVTANAPTIETSMASIEKTKKPRKDAALKRAEAKMSPEVLVIYRCASARSVSAASTTCKTNSSAVKVTVELTELKADLEKRLTNAGLKIVSGSGSQELTGMIEPAKLRQLAQIAEVKSISLSQ